jgi:hypothetical protein
MPMSIETSANEKTDQIEVKNANQRYSITIGLKCLQEYKDNGTNHRD